ncbi:hypothetical protein Tco_1195409 [Tanacetum coccineum]
MYNDSVLTIDVESWVTCTSRTHIFLATEAFLVRVGLYVLAIICSSCAFRVITILLTTVPRWNKKYRGLNSSKGGNIRDGVKIAGGVIGSGGGIESSEELKEVLPDVADEAEV